MDQLLKRVPEPMRKLKRWVCCQEGSKIPMSAMEYRAVSPSDPDDWESFEQAALCVEEGIYDYVGFVFAGDGIVGIDIDEGFFEGLMTPLCADIMDLCKSYTEKSRSGRGVHIYLRGKLPFDGANNRNGVEIYQNRRFFIVTGKMIEYEEIIENQSAIDEILKRYFSQSDLKPVSGDFTERTKIYTPRWAKPSEGRIFLKPEYPTIGRGCRNVSLLSLAGSMVNAGYNKTQIYEELMLVNETVCETPLKLSEVQSITDSAWKYRRRT